MLFRSPSTGQPSGVDVHRVATVRRRIRINNKEASPFGAGWNLEELKEIVTNPDGSVLYVTIASAAPVWS